MIFADKLIEQRKRCGWSQEELAEKLNVSRQAVSKWESAQSTPDLQRVLLLADLFGVSTDYLLKDEMESAPNLPREEISSSSLRTLSMQEANDFLAVRQILARKIPLGVVLCILSPVLLILLAGFSDSQLFGISEGLAAGVGILALLSMVAIAVFLFITYSMKEKPYEWMQTQGFETAYGVTGMVRERKQAYDHTFTRNLALGVVSCILSALPLVIGAILGASDAVCCALVCVLLIIVSAGVYLIVRAAMIRSGYDTLLQEGEYTAETKHTNRKLSGIFSAYWALVTAIYLGWSFKTGDWKNTWIIWPVAGVLFAVVASIARTIAAPHDSDR